MRYLRRAFFLVVVLSFVFVIGCSDDESSPTGNNNTSDQAPTFSIDSITVPPAMAQSSDLHAQMAVTYIALANSFSAYGMWFYPPSTSPKDTPVPFAAGGPWVYTWTVDSLTITLTITEQGDKWVWEITFTGTDDGEHFNNWLFIHAEAAKDDSTGVLIVYEPVTTDIAVRWTWSVDSQGTRHIVYEVPGVGGTKIEVTAYSDNSGELKYYEYVNGQYVMLTRIVWNSNGSGQWWTYDYDGVLTGSGSWS